MTPLRVLIYPGVADYVAGVAQRREDVRRDARFLHDVRGPGPRRAGERRGGGRVGHLGPGRAGQPVREQVGDQQQRTRGGQRGAAGGGGELVDRVERQVLDAGYRVEIGERETGRDRIATGG